MRPAVRPEVGTWPSRAARSRGNAGTRFLVPGAGHRGVRLGGSRLPPVHRRPRPRPSASASAAAPGSVTRYPEPPPAPAGSAGPESSGLSPRRPGGDRHDASRGPAAFPLPGGRLASARPSLPGGGRRVRLLVSACRQRREVGRVAGSSVSAVWSVSEPTRVHPHALPATALVCGPRGLSPAGPCGRRLAPRPSPSRRALAPSSPVSSAKPPPPPLLR